MGQVDPATGALIPDDGLGEFIDDGLVPLTWRNGPEWMEATHGPELTYSRLVPGSAEMMRAWQDDGGAWHTAAYPDGVDRMHPFGSRDIGDPEPRILYVDPIERVMYWRYLDGPERFLTDAFLEFSARWVPDSHDVIYAAPTDEGRQVFLHDVDTDAITQLTFPPGAYGDTFMWTDPSLGARVFFATLNDELGRPIGLGIFVEVDGVWQMVQQIDPPADLPYVISPEPFVFEGHSYIAYAVSSEPVNIDDGPADIWISGLLDAADVHRRVSEGDRVVRFDPESLVTDETVWIYYSQFDFSTGAWTMRRCATGL